MLKRVLVAALVPVAIVLDLAGLCSAAHAKTRALAVASAEVTCWASFEGGKAPAAAGDRGPTQDLCFPAYALRESGAWRQPIWSAAHITAAQLPPRGADRKNAFHIETALPADMQSKPADWEACSDKDDRGHAIAVGFFVDVDQRFDSFSLANMMTQAKANNEQIWHNIEHAERDAVKAAGDVYDVTGPHIPAVAPTWCGALPQADAIWKAVYFPSTGVIGAYWTPNDDSQKWEAITIAELIARTGVDPFPALPADKKAEVHTLPAPIAGGGD